MQFIIEICYNIKNKKEEKTIEHKSNKKEGSRENEKRAKTRKHNSKTKSFLNRCFIFAYILNKEKFPYFFLEKS